MCLVVLEARGWCQVSLSVSLPHIFWDRLSCESDLARLTAYWVPFACVSLLSAVIIGVSIQETLLTCPQGPSNCLSHHLSHLGSSRQGYPLTASYFITISALCWIFCLSDGSKLTSPACGTHSLPSPPFSKCWAQQQAPLPTDHLAGVSYKILLSMSELESRREREGKRGRKRETEGESTVV